MRTLSAMFIRKTKITHVTTRKVYWNHQLVESYRTENGPRQRILLNLGSDLDLTPQERKALANRIEEMLRGFRTLLSPEPKIEELAQKYVRELQQQLDAQLLDTPQPETDLHTIDVNTIEQQEARTVGGEHLLLHIAEQLHLPKTLRAFGFSDEQVAISLGLIIGRAVSPASERATHQWLCNRSGLGELLGFNFLDTSLDKLYRTGDLLLKHKHALEAYLPDAHRKVHGHRSTLALYDLSNTYLTGSADKNSKARHGVSKEKRYDCPLVTLGLIIDEHGFATRSMILPGNVAEVSTLQDALLRLRLDNSLIKPVIVLDAGLTSEENLKWLRDNHYLYVVSARQNAPSTDLLHSLVSVNATSSDVKVAFVRCDNSEERWLYCESSAKAALTQQMRKLFQERLETDLKNMATSLEKPKGRKKYIRVLERIGRLKEKHKRISGCYEITVQVSDDGLTATAITWQQIPEKIESRLNGHYFLRTNLLDIEPDALWHLYGNLRTIEDAFRFMKSSLGLRPVYHQIEGRVDAHLWITLLAYHLIQGCLYTLRQHDIRDTWESVRNALSTRMRVTMQAKTAEGSVLRYRSTIRSEEHQNRIYRAMGLSPQVLRSKKVVI